MSDITIEEWLKIKKEMYRLLMTYDGVTVIELSEFLKKRHINTSIRSIQRYIQTDNNIRRYKSKYILHQNAKCPVCENRIL